VAETEPQEAAPPVEPEPPKRLRSGSSYFSSDIDVQQKTIKNTHKLNKVLLFPFKHSTI
jgi:hypothetical protein